jgi:hypothetical protein
MLALLVLVGLAFADDPSAADSIPVEPIAAVLKTCTTVEPPAVASRPVSGALLLQVRVRRGRVAVVTTVEADPGVAPLGQCFERELVGWGWGARRGRFDVPVIVDEEEP